MVAINNKHIIKDMSSFSVFALTSTGEPYYLSIQEGTGESLMPEDEKAGFVDYADFECFHKEHNVIYGSEGGYILLTVLYKRMSPERIVFHVLQHIGIADEVIRVIALPDNVDREFFEEIVEQDLDNLDEELSFVYNSMTDCIQTQI